MTDAALTAEGDLAPWMVRHAMDAGSFAREVLGWAPDAKQMSVLRTTSRRVVLNCARAWGKSTVTATRVVHAAVMRPALIWACRGSVSANLSQTGEFFLKVDTFLQTLGIEARGEAGKRLARRLPNGSRIVGIAAREAAVRSYTADFVFIDEAARIEDDVIDAFTPVIAVRRGELWMASTPKGKRGRFYEAWAYGGPNWLKVSVPASENPRFDQELVEQCRREKGQDYVKREFECEFVENGVEAMSLEEVDAIIV